MALLEEVADGDLDALEVAGEHEALGDVDEPAVLLVVDVEVVEDHREVSFVARDRGGCGRPVLDAGVVVLEDAGEENERALQVEVVRCDAVGWRDDDVAEGGRAGLRRG
jgi:hypothetical protein